MNLPRSRAALAGPILALGMFAAGPVQAGASDRRDDGTQAAAILVTGHGLEDGPAVPAYDVATIGRGAITASPSGRIEDVLSAIAGFQQFRRTDSRAANPSAQGVTLRALGGNASSRALLLLDGVPVANPFFGYVPLSALSPDRLSTVRVTRGGGAGAFGAGAVSGTIELTSAGPDEIGALQAAALVDQRGETQLSATAAPRLGQGFVVASGQWDGGLWDRGQGFWTTPKDQRVAASARAAYESWSGSLRAVAPLTDTIEIQASGLAYHNARTLRFQGADSTSSGQQASLRLVGRGEWRFDVLGYVQAQDFSNVVISSSSFKKTLDQAKTPTLAVGGKAELRPPVGAAHVLRLGADLRLAEGHLVEVPYTAGAPSGFRRAGGDQSNLGLYAEDDWTLGAFVLTAGLRADRWTICGGFFRELNAAGAVSQDTTFPNRSGWNANARGGLVWHAGKALSLRAAAYTGMRVPTLNELYRPFVVFPVRTAANAALKPERLRGYEAGIDLHPAPGLSLSLTAFDNRLEDAIANVTIGTNLRERQNVDAIHARGIEASADLSLGQVSLNGSLAWTDSKVEASGAQAPLDGMRPAQVPRLATSATLAWAPRPGWRLAATLRHLGAQYEDDLQADTLPAATTLDAYALLPLAGPFSLVLRGENLADETVVTRNQAGSIDLGTPRTLWAGIKVGLR
ncbi:Outer membrane cobalamin receptor protein [Novosphingobium sp. CF614]|uniref:TonB-dependent receptor plug domain-containing protein n=1 Tax=Novosphingobium sp. CF614 TaxID=1884364 RepID=UPI0008E5E9A2|nr:TonB-dependent receptor [Novosphingobium sp. CF614]SFF87816.1 Outer membrane cobalamin receptor protein [Novosphingobium sp. CF614]